MENTELKERIVELEEELAQIKQTLNMCANCHKIRDKKNNWHPVADYLRSHREIETSHGICPDCTKKLYPEFCKE